MTVTAHGIPMAVPAGGTISGVLREDALREASIDLEAITRGELNPFAAIYNVNENDPACRWRRWRRPRSRRTRCRR